VETAYEQYKENKDKECEASIKKILALDPKNKDAFMLRANIAMFANDIDGVWKNLNIIYKNNPTEPEIYSQFAVNHLTYMFFSDSMKRVLCRKTILLSSKSAEGYASLGLVAAVGGNYEEALRYFDIGFAKHWKDTNSRTILRLPYARCQYEMGMKQEAINTISGLMGRIKGDDRYTCMYMRATYKMEMGQNDVGDDIDSLTNVYPNDIGVKRLRLKYMKNTGMNADSTCTLARFIRDNTEDNNFDISEYCNDMLKALDVKAGSRMTYDIKGNTFIVEPTSFDYRNEIKFTWYRGLDAKSRDTGKVVIPKNSLDSAFAQQNYFDNGENETLVSKITVWLSRKQFNDLAKDSFTYFATDGFTSKRFQFAGHEQVEIFNKKNESVLVDCLKVSDGEESICYLNDINNPLIVKMNLKAFTITLTKFE
jgi:tetratricopeptide (TPR) repeat protein